MRLIGLLSWFDEPPHDIERCIRSFHACGMTHLVCCDGAYGLFPDARPVSDSRQHETIAAVCNELAIDLRLFLPPDVWPTETEKRAMLFEIAELQFDTTAEDWFVVIDADEYVPDPVDLRPLLRRVTLDAADVHVDEPGGGGNPAKSFAIRKLFRALPGLTVCFNHHTYAAGDTVLWGYGQVVSADLPQVTVRHMTNLRPARRRAVKETYYRDRETAGIEAANVCFKCGAEGTVKMRSGFTYDRATSKLRSNHHLACEQHARILQYRNRNAIRKIMAEIANTSVIFDPDLMAKGMANHMAKHGEDIARAFGETNDTLPALLRQALLDAQRG